MLEWLLGWTKRYLLVGLAFYSITILLVNWSGERLCTLSKWRNIASLGYRINALTMSLFLHIVGFILVYILMVAFRIISSWFLTINMSPVIQLFIIFVIIILCLPIFLHQIFIKIIMNPISFILIIHTIKIFLIIIWI